jgi:hypothetical protein
MKTYVNNENFLEFVSEIATLIVEERFGVDTYSADENGDLYFTEKAKDYFNEQFEIIEEKINTILNIYVKP